MRPASPKQAPSAPRHQGKQRIPADVGLTVRGLGTVAACFRLRRKQEHGADLPTRVGFKAQKPLEGLPSSGKLGLFVLLSA